MRAPRGAGEAFLRAHVAYAGDDCVIWPFAKNKKGYGWIAVGGLKKAASRWMCIFAHGEPPSPAHESAHSCGNRACINPDHIRWATSAENKADRDSHGTTARGEHHGRAFLSAVEVAAIRADVRSQRAIAACYGISKRNVAHIRRRETWSHVL